MDYNKLTEEARRRGAMLSGDALMPTTSATTVRVCGGKTLTADRSEGLAADCRDVPRACDASASPVVEQGFLPRRPISAGAAGR